MRTSEKKKNIVPTISYPPNLDLENAVIQKAAISKIMKKV
jgi:hypothetical protein